MQLKNKTKKPTTHHVLEAKTLPTQEVRESKTTMVLWENVIPLLALFTCSLPDTASDRQNIVCKKKTPQHTSDMASWDWCVLMFHKDSTLRKSLSKGLQFMLQKIRRVKFGFRTAISVTGRIQ